MNSSSLTLIQSLLDGRWIDRAPGLVRFAGVVLLGMLFAVVVLVSIPPWIHYFASGYGEHWDTRLMGQWMSFNAQHILSGNVWLPDFNANFFYPHANTLAFSESLWPQSFVYALIYHLTGNPFLAFNGTMLIFWALSGIVMYLLAMELGTGRWAAVLAGLIYCLIPYRLAYYIEFNMSLTFCVPLLWLAYIRWMKVPSLMASVAFVAVFWIVMTSSIYYTIIAGLVLCLVHVFELVNQPHRLRTRNYWLFGGAVGLACATLALVFLQPYIELRGVGDYARTHDDWMRHHLQAGHYVYPAAFNIDYSVLGARLQIPDLRIAEVIAFPGSVLAALTLVFVLHTALVAAADLRRANPIRSFLKVTKLVLWAAFWIIILTSWLVLVRGQMLVAPQVLQWVAAALIITTVVLALWPDQKPGQRLRAFGAGALICFFISLGPQFTIGMDKVQAELGASPIGWAFTALPIFEAVRGLSRFSIVVLTFLTLASCVTFGHLARHRLMIVWLIPAFAAVLMYEGHQNFYKFIDEADQTADAAVERIAQLPRDVPIVQLPIGPRHYDAQAAMLTVLDHRPLVNGHSGFAPDYYLEWSALLREWDVATLSRDFLSIWPQPWLLVDRKAVEKLGIGWRRPFPTTALHDHWREVTRGEHYTLYQPLVRELSGAQLTQWLRRDVLAAHSLLSFEARSDAKDSRVAVTLNDKDAGSRSLTSAWQTFEFPMPLEAGGALSGERVVLNRVGGDSWQVRDITFRAPAGSIASD